MLDQKRGSEKLMAAWKKRMLTDESVQEIAAQLAQSPAKLEQCMVYGGGAATGMRLSLSYEGEDVPRCGNDLSFWLQWQRKHGGTVTIPHILTKGIPFPELVSVVLDFGHVGPGPIEMGELQGMVSHIHG